MIDSQTLRRMPRFSGLSEAAESWVCERLSMRSYGRGETIFLEGDPCRHFFLVQEGEVKVYKVLESGRELILDIFHSGEAFGEVALVDGGEFPANASAMEQARVLILSREDYIRMLEHFPEVAHSIIRDLSLRLHSMRKRVEVLGEGGVQSRIAQMLQVYARQMGQKTPEGISIPVHLTRQEMAALVCARIETVIRIMSRWQKEELVITRPDGFLVPQTESLQDMISPGE